MALKRGVGRKFYIKYAQKEHRQRNQILLLHNISKSQIEVHNHDDVGPVEAGMDVCDSGLALSTKAKISTQGSTHWGALRRIALPEALVAHADIIHLSTAYRLSPLGSL